MNLQRHELKKELRKKQKKLHKLLKNPEQNIGEIQNIIREIGISNYALHKSQNNSGEIEPWKMHPVLAEIARRQGWIKNNNRIKVIKK
jgi:cell division FtsZ-interacting protein ZapD